MKKAVIIKSITSIALVTSMMIGMAGNLPKRLDKSSSEELSFYTLSGNTFAASRAQAAVQRTVKFTGAVSRTVTVDSGRTLGWILSQYGITAPRGYNYTFKNSYGTGINTNYTITSNETITITKNVNYGQVILHNLGSPSGSPRILNLKTGDKLSSYISMRSDYDKKYLLAVTSSVQYGGKKYFHPKYVPSLVIEPSEPRQEFTGVWIGRGESKTITYTMSRADVQNLRSLVVKEINSLQNGQTVNRVLAAAIVSTITSFLFTPVAGIIVGAATGAIDLGDPSTNAAIQEMQRVKTLCDTALSQGGSMYSMKVQYDYKSNAGYNACLEADVNCKIISFNRI